MKTVRSLLLLTVCLLVASFLAAVPTCVIAIGLALAIPTIHLYCQRSNDAICARTNLVLMAVLLLILTRHDLTLADHDAPHFVLHPKLGTTISEEHFQQAKAERKKVRDTDRDQWRKEMQERLERLKR